MKKHLAPAAALFLALPACAQTGFDRLFDGGRGGAGLESVLPVIRGGFRAPEPSRDSALPVRAADVMADTGERVPVALEILIAPAAPQPTVLMQGIGRLSSAYGFFPDNAFAPVPLASFHILPYPAIPSQRQAYLIRGVVPAAKLEALKADDSIRELWQGGRSADEKALQEVLFRYEDALRETAGVRDVYLGYDCGLQAEHAHVQPHHPRIVVVVDPAVDASSVRQRVFESAPILAVQPVFFQAQ